MAKAPKDNSSGNDRIIIHRITSLDLDQLVPDPVERQLAKYELKRLEIGIRWRDGIISQEVHDVELGKVDDQEKRWLAALELALQDKADRESRVAADGEEKDIEG